MSEGEQLLGGLAVGLDHGPEGFLSHRLRNGVHIHTVIGLKGKMYFFKRRGGGGEYKV